MHEMRALASAFGDEAQLTNMQLSEARLAFEKCAEAVLHDGAVVLHSKRVREALNDHLYFDLEEGTVDDLLAQQGITSDGIVDIVTFMRLYAALEGADFGLDMV